MAGPSKKEKILFWIVLGALSVFFAEVVSSSDPFPFFHAFGLLLVFPLYALHSLVLAYIVFNYGKARFYALFAAGTVFGLYEAYITKVLWAPPWESAFPIVGGIAVVETMMLVLFWHAFMAFIIPLFVSENILTSSREIVNGLPKRIKQLFSSRKKTRNALIFFALFCGITQSVLCPSPVISLLSVISNSAVIILLVYLWRNKTKGKKYGIGELLPNKKEFTVLFVLLILLYIATGIGLRPEALPGLGAQAVIWAVYAGAFILLALTLKKSKKIALPKTFKTEVKFSWKLVLALVLLFTATATLAKPLLGPLAEAVPLLVWIAGIAIGLVVLLSAIKDMLSKTKAL